MGFFVCFSLLWFNQDTVAQQIALTSRSLGLLESESIDEGALFDWMKFTIKEQHSTLNLLMAENEDLRSELVVLHSMVATSSLELFSAPPTQQRILLVMGHTQDQKGAVYGELTEYELNYDLITQLEQDLVTRGCEVIVLHEDGHYSQSFQDYFETHEDKILNFRAQQKEEYAREYPMSVVTNDTDHNYASKEATIQLYGINMWTTENEVDVVIHVHFNDYPGRVWNQVGTHTGFSLFTSLKTNDNFIESFRLAKLIEQEMLQYANRSTVEKESAGVLESELIAVGQANSVIVPAVLFEGGFIYEDKFTNPVQRKKEFTDYTQAIGQAIDRYFNN